MPFYENPEFAPSLRDARYWSLDWIAENSIAGPFAYVVLLKADGGYRVHGQFATATEAFNARRNLVAESGNRSFFLRAVRIQPVEVVGPGHPDSREDLDRYRDALATCDESLIAPEELPAFRQWAAKEIEDRPFYHPTSRVQHGEIPF